MKQTGSNQRRAGSRKQKRKARLDRKWARRNRAAQHVQPEGLVGIAQSSGKAGDVVEVLVTHPENLHIETMMDLPTAMTSTNLLDTLDRFMDAATPGSKWTYRRDDPLSASALRARISRAAKKHERKVSIHMEATEVALVMGR